jgi:chemotaxis protein MotB
MIWKFHSVTAVLAAAIISSGCVSTGTFEKMQTAKDAEINTLQQQNASLEQQRTTLEQQKNAAEQANAELKGQVQSTAQKNTAMQEQVGFLEDQKAALLAASQRRQQQYDTLVQNLSKEVQKGQLQVKQYQNMLTVDLAEQIFFDSGRATLKSGGKEVLKKIAEALKGYESKVIRVVGHTDNVPVAKSLQGTFPSNWELSVARATNVVRFLQDAGVPPERMVASGRSEYDPVAPNDTPEGRQKNRRIEIMLIDKSLTEEMGKSVN